MRRDDLDPHLLPLFDQACAALNAGRSVLLVGVPGVGKTMMARRLAPRLSPATSVLADNRALHRICARREPIGDDVPFRAPHHTCSMAGMMGGGRPARPGEVSLAHGGLLFLDEIPEFSMSVLNAVAHAYIYKSVEHGRWRFPADFWLLGAANPCPCGWHGTPRCTCSSGASERYMGRIPKGMFDVVLEIPRVARARERSHAL